MQIFIREAQSADAESIAGLSQQLGYNMSVADTSMNLETIRQSGNDIAHVAVHDDRIVGWIHVFLAVRLESACFCEIGGLVVHKQYRRMGIGNRLINHVQYWCISKQASMLRVRSNVKRVEAHQFYVRSGFEELKEQKVFEKNLSDQP